MTSPPMTTQQPVPRAGKIEGLALPAAFGAICASRARGALSVEQGAEPYRIFFREGRPSGMVSSPRSTSLGDYLLEQGIIDRATLTRVNGEAAKKRRSGGRILVEMGCLTPEDLAGHLKAHQIAQVAAALALREGAFAFDPEAELPPWSEETELDPFLVLLTLLERPEEIDRVGALIRDLSDAALTFVPNRFILTEVALDEEARLLLSRLHRPTSAVDLMASSGIAIERVGAVLASCWCLGLVGFASEEQIEAAVASFSQEGSLEASAAEQGPTEAGVEGRDERRGGHSSPADAAFAQVSDRRDPSAQGKDSDERGGSEPTAGAPPEPPSARRRSTADDGELRARRSRLIRRAFKNIPGADRLGRGDGAAVDAPSGSKGDGEKKTPDSNRSPVSTPPVAGEVGADAGAGEKVASSAAARTAAREIESLSKNIAGQDFYKRLSVSRTASEAQIKEAYLVRAKRFHPDRAGALGLGGETAAKMKGVFEAVQEAYDTLRDKRKRKEYDAATEGSGPEGSSDRKRGRALAQAEIDFKKGHSLFKKKDYSRALVYLESALNVDSRNGLWLTIHAWAKYNIGPRDAVKDDVRKLLMRATEVDGATGLAHYYLGIIARMDDRLDWAERHFSRAVEGDSKIPEAVSELREVRRKLGKDKLSQTKSLFKRVLGK